MTTTTATAIEIIRDAYIASDVPGLTYRLDGDQTTAILEVDAEFFAISHEPSGYSWAWGERSEDGTDFFGQDGDDREHAAREAVAEWLARFSR